jgi:predicted RNA-binding Zn ribbon-like protein
MSYFPAQASVWWRSGIKISGESIVPEPPFVPYNPFDWYFPIESATREQRSLPYLFLDIDANDIQAVTRFSERFGVLGNFQNVGWAQWAAESEPVYSLFTDGQSQQQGKETLTKANVYRAAAGARPNQTLCVPMSLTEFRDAQIELQETIELTQRASGQPIIVPPLHQDDPYSHLSLVQIRKRASFCMASRLTMIRPRPVWDVVKDRWVTIWDVGTLEAAMYLMVLFDIQGRGQILTCPRCRKVFVADRSRTQFCSSQCQNAAKVQRFRARQAQGGETLDDQ